MNLIKRSIELDLEFIKLGLPAGDKLAFIIKKYSLLIKNFVFGFTKNKSYISVFKRKYYFDDRFGIAFLQSVYIDNAFLKNYVPPNATIVDIGGNIGQFRFFCENYLSTEKVYSFEPVKETYKTLVLNFPYRFLFV